MSRAMTEYDSGKNSNTESFPHSRRFGPTLPFWHFPNYRIFLQATVKKFLFEEELEAYRKLRNQSKASKLLEAVFQGGVSLVFIVAFA